MLPARKPNNVPTSDFQAGHAQSEDSHTPTPPLSHQPRKLRKARKDGYDSDGGYLSDSLKKKKKKKDKKGQKKGSGSSFGPEHQSDGEHLSDLTKKGVDKKKQKGKGSKTSDDLDADPSVKTSKASTKKFRMPSDDGDVSDGGHLSEAAGKKKRSFFSRRSRSPLATRKAFPTDTPPPVPTLPLTPIPTSGDFMHSPNPFNSTDGSIPRGGTPIWAAHYTVPPSLNERPDSSSSLQGRDRSLSPEWDNVRSTTRSLSVDTNSERLTPSTTSHEIGWHSPVRPLAVPWDATSYAPRPHEPEMHPRPPTQPQEQPPASAPASSRVRFTPSTRFDSSDGIIPSQPYSPAVTITSEEPLSRPKFITHDTLKASPSPGPPSPVSPVRRNASPMSAPSASRPFLSPSLLSTPSLSTLAVPSPRGVSPAFSESSVVSSSEFIVPSPRPRFFEDLPPPSPPPTGPLPEVPLHGPYSHLVPQIKRGRQPPFPTRGILPVQDASRLIERTERRRLEAQAESADDATGSDVYGDLPHIADRVVLVPPSPPHDDSQEDEYDWPDDESVRPDVAQFYFFESPGLNGSTAGPVAPRPPPHEPDDLATFKFPFVRSLSSENIPASPITPSVPSDIHSYYSEETSRDGGGEDGEGRSQFFDDEHNRVNGAMRARLMVRADAFQGGEKIRPVPRLRPF